MSAQADKLIADLGAALGERAAKAEQAFGEVTLTAGAGQLLEIAHGLRDHPELRFEMLVDLCGIDYSGYSGGAFPGRYAAVYHLLSISRNRRLRLRVFAPEESFPVLPTVTGVWPSANWYEREAFDLFGIMFTGHPDLRRILTDYGFIGHPFRKDFPVSGYVEMRYDIEQGRVIYQPVTIEPRVIVPRVVREPQYGDVI